MFSATIQDLLHEIPFLRYLEDLLLHKVQIKLGLTFISYKIWILRKYCLSSVQKTKAIGLHWDLENKQAGPAACTEPPPPHTAVCTQVAEASAVPLPKLQQRHLKSDSFLCSWQCIVQQWAQIWVLLRLWVISSHVDKVHFIKDVWDRLKKTLHGFTVFL